MGGDFEVRQELRHIAGILSEACEAAKRVNLDGSSAAARCFEVLNFTAHEMNSGWAAAERFEVNFQRAGTIERAQGADAVASACQEHSEAGHIDDAVNRFEFCGSKEFDA